MIPQATDAVYRTPQDQPSPPSSPTPQKAPRTPPKAPEQPQPTEENSPDKAAPLQSVPAPGQITDAKAALVSMKDGSAIGTITFHRDSSGVVTIDGDFNGLPKKGTNALYIHEKGDCSNKGKNVGKHLDPTHAKHGPPSSSMRHAGDFGNLSSDESGHATFAMTTDSVTLEQGRADSVIGRAVVIHSRKDDKMGNAGAPLACGVIEVVGE